MLAQDVGDRRADGLARVRSHIAAPSRFSGTLCIRDLYKHRLQDRPATTSQDAALSTIEITPEMVTAAALVLERRFDCSQGIAAIVAEDLLRVALCRKSEGQRSAAADLRESFSVFVVAPLYPPGL